MEGGGRGVTKKGGTARKKTERKPFNALSKEKKKLLGSKERGGGGNDSPRWGVTDGSKSTFSYEKGRSHEEKKPKRKSIERKRKRNGGEVVAGMERHDRNRNVQQSYRGRKRKKAEEEQLRKRVRKGT